MTRLPCGCAATPAISTSDSRRRRATPRASVRWGISRWRRRRSAWRRSCASATSRSATAFRMRLSIPSGSQNSGRSPRSTTSWVAPLSLTRVVPTRSVSRPRWPRGPSREAPPSPRASSSPDSSVTAIASRASPPTTAMCTPTPSCLPRDCGLANSPPRQASTCPCRLQSTITCSRSRWRACIAICRSSRTSTATATSARRVAACSWASSSPRPPVGIPRAPQRTSPSARFRPTGSA